MSNNRIKVSDLDYNQIRENLKTFMRGQDQFTDYDFDGSALSTLIDLLAYNTHYNALYTNLAINEMFLDSASKRSSVVSIANNYGYTPLSATTSRAKIGLSLVDTNVAAPEVKYLPKFTPFATTVENIPYTFYTLQDYVAQRAYNATSGYYSYVFSDVDIYEGSPQTVLFVCTELGQKFNLPNKNIDIATLSVTVQPTGEQPDYEKYTRATDILELMPDSKVYFVKELEDQTYQIYFGSAGLGLPIETGNIITVQYMVTSADAANGASSFAYNGQNLGGSTPGVTVVSPSYGGKAQETVEEIKLNVSKNFFNQNRAVTPDDYASLIKRYYTNLDSVSVWGGEDNDPVQYGKVYISIKPTTGPYLTPSEKSYISESLLKSKNVVSVTPVIVDPSYLELDINTTVYYNKNKTTRSIDELKTAITNGIKDYRETNLQKYDGIFRMSKFSAMIDGIDQSIMSNITRFTVWCEMYPRYDVAAEYRLNLVNPIYSEKVPEESFRTTGFYLDSSDTIYYMDDDGVGSIRLYSVISATGEKVIKNPSIGTINYETGVVKINGLKITGLYEPNFYFIVKTASYDVVSVRNQIVDIPDSRITVNIIQDITSSGTYQGGTNYTFTKSR